MEIIHDDYQVHYDQAKAVVTCKGSFRLHGGEEYQPILELLFSAADAAPKVLTLDVSELQFLNSSGINTLSKFILRIRKNEASQVLIKGSSRFPWQAKSLKNFQRLLPGLQMEIS